MKISYPLEISSKPEIYKKAELFFLKKLNSRGKYTEIRSGIVLPPEIMPFSFYAGRIKTKINGVLTIYKNKLGVEAKIPIYAIPFLERSLKKDFKNALDSLFKD